MSVLEINLVVGVVAFLLLAYLRWRSQRKLYFKYYGGMFPVIIPTRCSFRFNRPAGRRWLTIADLVASSAGCGDQASTNDFGRMSGSQAASPSPPFLLSTKKAKPRWKPLWRAKVARPDQRHLTSHALCC